MANHLMKRCLSLYPLDKCKLNAQCDTSSDPMDGLIKQIKNVEKDVEKLESSSIVGRNIK